MARGEQILRQWNLLRQLQTRGEGLPLRQLSRKFGVSERTMQRDFELLEELGFPLEHHDDDCGKRYWRMPHDFFHTGPLVLGLTEAISLHLAEKLLLPLSGTLFEEGIRSILTKVRSILPASAMDYFADLQEIVYVLRTDLTDHRACGPLIHTLTRALRNECSVEMDYQSLWRDRQYITRFDPYGLVYYDGDLFAVGRSHRAQDVRVFKLIRIREARLTSHTFQRPEGFHLEQQFRHSFGIFSSRGTPLDIKVKFIGTAANWVEERIWHETQQLAWLDNEATLFDEVPQEPRALMASFRLADVVEFKRWVMGFGRQAEVLSPDWLRQDIHQELLAAADRYLAPG